MNTTKESFSQDSYQSNEKHPKKKKSRSASLKEWRKNNPDKVKEHRKKADRNYYQKNRNKYIDNAKIRYHEYYITHGIPATHECEKCDTWEALADHDCFPQWWPHQIWHHRGNEPSEDQIKKNIKFVINLQRKEKIPTFLVYPPQVYLNRQKYSNECWKKLESLAFGKDKKRDAKKEWQDFDKEMQECFSKVSNEIYEKRLGLSSNKDNEKQLEEDQ